MMTITKILLLLCIVGIGILFYFNHEVDTKIKTVQEKKINCKPTFVDGGGPYYFPNAPFRDILSPEVNNGEPLIVSGKLLRNDCLTPVAKGVIDIWHANEEGKYVNDWYRGRIYSDENGSYRFHTVIPKGYGEGTGYRPPHIHFKIFIDEKEMITSQMFFPEIAGTEGFDDAFIMNVESKDEQGQKVHYATHDIILP